MLSPPARRVVPPVRMYQLVEYCGAEITAVPPPPRVMMLVVVIGAARLSVAPSATLSPTSVAPVAITRPAPIVLVPPVARMLPELSVRVEPEPASVSPPPVSLRALIVRLAARFTLEPTSTVESVEVAGEEEAFRSVVS